MDVNALPVSPEDLYARLGTAKAPLLIDVRQREAFVGIERIEEQARGVEREAVLRHQPAEGGELVRLDGEGGRHHAGPGGVAGFGDFRHIAEERGGGHKKPWCVPTR